MKLPADARSLGRSRRLLLAAVTVMMLVPGGVPGQETAPQRPRMMCGSCPSGFAVTGVTTAPEICKEGDPTLLECVPLGTNLLSVCGSCPSGYREVGSSSLPARCGTAEGGRMSQCQLETLGQQLPDASQGGVFCPPHCGELPAAGHGNLPPPPQYIPAPPEPADGPHEPGPAS